MVNSKKKKHFQRLKKLSVKNKCDLSYLLKYNNYKRKPFRLHLPGKICHTYSRCIRKAPLLKKKELKKILIEVINMAQEKYEFNMLDFVIMDNHFHFLIQTVEGGANISRIMQYIKSRFAQKYNKLMDTTGPFWNERFGDKIVELAEDPALYFYYLIWYFGYNPVKAGLVTDPTNYPYGALNCYLDKEFKPPIKISFHKYFKNLGYTFSARARQLRKYENKIKKIYLQNSNITHFDEIIFFS